MASSNNISKVSPHENMNKNATQKAPLKLTNINIKLLSDTALLSSIELFSSSSTNEKTTKTTTTTFNSKLTNSKSLVSLATTITRVDPSLNELKEMVGTTHKNEATNDVTLATSPKIKRDISMPLLCPECPEDQDGAEDSTLQKNTVEDNFKIKEFCKSVTEIHSDNFNCMNENFNKGSQLQQQQQQQQQQQKRKIKRSALAWVGRTVGKRVVKKQPNTAYIHTYNNNHHYHHDNPTTTTIATCGANSNHHRNNNTTTSSSHHNPATTATLQKLK
jgi:hypothetical protein